MAPRTPSEKSITDYACLDIHRETRTGVPEVILAEGKRKDHLLAIVKEMLTKRGRAIITRVDEGLLDAFDFEGYTTVVNREARTVVIKRRGSKVDMHGGTVAIITAGTSDFAVGEEARVVAEELGCKVITFHDVGVAGVHRLFEALDRLDLSRVDVFITLAGREGALPTLVSGLVDAPVIGVPVSTGYGKGGKGEAALMAMLQSCSPLVVVNIDAGFIAGVVAARIATRMANARKRAQTGRTKRGTTKKK